VGIVLIKFANPDATKIDSLVDKVLVPGEYNLREDDAHQEQKRGGQKAGDDAPDDRAFDACGIHGVISQGRL
jgi:hypothetical protein